MAFLTCKVTRIIEIYEGLKSYFISLSGCPKLLETFFSNPQSELWLHFIHSQLKIFSNAIKNLEGDNISASEVALELELLKQKVCNRKENNFKNSKIESIILKLENENLLTERGFHKITNEFYETFLEYLNKRTSHFEPLKSFSWVELKEAPTWQQIQKCAKCFHEIGNKMIIIDEDELFDEVMIVREAFEHKIEDWKANNTPVDKRWCEIFKNLEDSGSICKHLKHIVSFALTIPGTNAAVERIFSLVNALWTDEKNRFSLESVKAMIITKTCFQDVSCLQFHEVLQKNEGLLQNIHSACKYIL